MKNSYQPKYTNIPKRLKLKGLGYFGHYAFVLLILLPFLLTIVNYILYIFGTYKGVIPIEELFEGTAIFVVLAFLLLIVQYNRLKFKSLETTLPPDKIIALCYKYAEVNKLKIKHVSQNEFVAVSKYSAFFDWGEWGEMLTVIIKKQKVYVNCICDPYKRPNIVSSGKNRTYKQTLIKTIKNASA